MRFKMKCHCVMAVGVIAFVSGFLNMGCWMTRNWRDYMPITEIALDKDVRFYRGYFYPRYTGTHALALRISRHSEENVFVKLRFRGCIRLFQGGYETSIPFDEGFDQVTLPPGPFNLYLKTFDAVPIRRSDGDYGYFDVTVEGDIEGFLEREPESRLSVSFCDAE